MHSVVIVARAEISYPSKKIRDSTTILSRRIGVIGRLVWPALHFFHSLVSFWSANLIMHAWLGNFVSEIPRREPVVARSYERALPEMLHFGDSGEIMYEVPLFPLPFCRSLLSLPLTPHPILLPEISFHDVQFGRAMKRPNRIGRPSGANNNRMKTNHRCQMTGRSLPNWFLLSLNSVNLSSSGRIDC